MSDGTTALAIVPHHAVSMSPYDPRDLSEARTLAKMFAESRLVKDVTTEARAMLIMATGAELGLPATTALRAIHVIEDKPSISAQLKIALCQRRKDICKYIKFTESTDEAATCETWRVGDDAPVTVRFTIQDAIKMHGLEKVNNQSGNWFKIRRRMLRYRAGGETCDFVYAEIVLGLVSTEELSDNYIDMKPLVVLDDPLVRAAATVAAVADVAKEERKEERRQEANDVESLEDAFKRWQAALNAATTTSECDKVARDAQKRLAKGSAEYDRAKAMVTATKERLKTAHERPPAPAAAQQSLPTNPIDREPPTREPGSDDE